MAPAYNRDVRGCVAERWQTIRNCNKCNENIPEKILNNGKFVNLRRRKYCIKCSPLRENTRGKDSTSPEAIECAECSRKYVFNYDQGHTKDRCNSCNAAYNKNAKRLRALEYLGGKCTSCGYNKCISALSFHHKNPELKSFTISGNYTRKWESLKEELDKCILLCLNCHAELHFTK